MTRYDDFTEMLRELDAAPGVIVSQSSIGAGPHPEDVRRVLDLRGISAADAFVDFCADIDYLEVQWSEAGGQSGSIAILMLEEMIDSAEDPAHWFNTALRTWSEATGTPEERRFLPFDLFLPHASACAALEMTGGAIGDQVFGFAPTDGIFELGLSLGEYCAELRRTRGIIGWQIAARDDAPSLRAAQEEQLVRIFGAGS